MLLWIKFSENTYCMICDCFIQNDKTEHIPRGNPSHSSFLLSAQMNSCKSCSGLQPEYMESHPNKQTIINMYLITQIIPFS